MDIKHIQNLCMKKKQKKKSEIEIKASIDFFKASKPAWIFFYSSSFLTSVADRIICYIMIYGYFRSQIKFYILNRVWLMICSSSLGVRRFV